MSESPDIFVTIMVIFWFVVLALTQFDNRNSNSK